RLASELGTEGGFLVYLAPARGVGVPALVVEASDSFDDFLLRAVALQDLDQIVSECRAGAVREARAEFGGQEVMALRLSESLDSSLERIGLGVVECDLAAFDFLIGLAILSLQLRGGADLHGLRRHLNHPMFCWWLNSWPDSPARSVCKIRKVNRVVNSGL